MFLPGKKKNLYSQHLHGTEAHLRCSALSQNMQACFCLSRFPSYKTMGFVYRCVGRLLPMQQQHNVWINMQFHFYIQNRKQSWSFSCVDIACAVTLHFSPALMLHVCCLPQRKTNLLQIMLWLVKEDTDRAQTDKTEQQNRGSCVQQRVIQGETEMSSDLLYCCLFPCVRQHEAGLFRRGGRPSVLKGKIIKYHFIWILKSNVIFFGSAWTSLEPAGFSEDV